MSVDPRKAILGTWRLVHSVEVGPGGVKRYPIGEDAIGYIIYTESGVMAVQITRRVRAPAGPEGVVGKKDYLAYFGATSWTRGRGWSVTGWRGNSCRATIPTIWKGSTTSTRTSCPSSRWTGRTRKSCGSGCEAGCTREFAERVGLSDWTVRNYCRLGRLRAAKKRSGRGAHPEWVLSHEELERYRKEGLLDA